MKDLRESWYLLSSAQRRSALILIGLMLIGMVLETLGIGLVIPALALMTQDDLATKYPIIEPWLNGIGNPSQEKLVVGGMIVLVVVYVVKALFLGFLAWWQARFTFALLVDVSQRLYTGYLRQPYMFHLQRNSAQLIRNTLGQVDELRSVIHTGLSLVAEALVLFSILILLVVVEPIGTLLVASTLGFAGWAFQKLTGERILRWGVLRQNHEESRLKQVQHGLGAAKDVKLLGREEDFLAQYQFHTMSNAKVGELGTTLQAFPRLWIELLAITALAVLVVVMIGQGKSLPYLLPTLGLFAAAAFRLLPSLNRILNAFQSIRYSSPVIGNLASELRLIDATVTPRRGPPLAFERALEMANVCFTYPSANMPVLSSVSVRIEKGTAVGFIGTTGAGKSTLVDILLGLFTPCSGVVLLDGIDINTNLRGWQDQIGYVSQSIFLTDDTLRRNIAFGLASDQIDENSVLRAVREAQLSDFVKDLPQGIDTVVGERGVRLSGGQRQRIGIARALYHDPAVLVLDEATSSLDTTTERGVMDAIQILHGKKTLIVVAHRLSTVEQCDRLYRLEKGRVIEEGSATNVLASMATRLAGDGQGSPARAEGQSNLSVERNS